MMERSQKGQIGICRREQCKFRKKIKPVIAQRILERPAFVGGLESSIGLKESAFGRGQNSQVALQAVAATLRTCDWMRWASFGDYVDRPRCGEIAVLHEIGSFGDVDMVDDFRDEPVKIGISLSMSIIGKI